MSLTKIALRFAAPVPKIGAYRRYLFIGPHPDDIEIGAGATAARLAAEGKDVCFLVCIDGRFGDGGTELRGDALAAHRQAEAIASAKALGVTDVRFLNLCDGGFYEMSELETKMAQVIGDFKPEMIFAPDPDVTSECHADHLNVGNAAKKLACFLPYPGIAANFGAESAPIEAVAFYFTAKPNRYFGTRGYVRKQLDAIFDCHLSQFPGDSGSAIRLYLKLRAADYGIRTLRGTAEGFRVLGQTHMHCLPEAGN